MATLTYAQLEGYWIGAGGPKALAPLMAAIAMAESSGKTDAHNPSGASGVWQILGAVNPADQNNLFDPKVNAKEAVLKYKSQGLTAWTTYSSGAYKQFLKGNVPPSANTGSTGSSGGSGVGGGLGIGFETIPGLGQLGGAVGTVTGVASTVGDVGTALQAIAKDIGTAVHFLAVLGHPSTWLRIGAFLGGLITLAMAIYFLSKAVGIKGPDMPAVMPIPV